MGYLHPSDPFEYGDEYWERYCGWSNTEMGRNLLEFRQGLVGRYIHKVSELCDVGIGAGKFIEDRPSWSGYDVNPHAVRWLKGRGQWGELYRPACWENLTFWDSLEHIADPGRALRQASQLAFVSLPIFEGKQDVLISKHFKPGEHLWYWTRAGFQRWSKEQGFSMVDLLFTETSLGRDSIETFVLSRDP